MTTKKKRSLKKRVAICQVCGKRVSKSGIVKDSEISSRSAYLFDSPECMLTFKKLNVIHGEAFLRKLLA
jgi:hypothetical protein